MFTPMLGSPQADAAAISAIAALLTAAYAHWRTSRASRDLEKLKDSLVARREDRNARRDYEYQARKRLYTEIEPLLFQLNEAAEKAFHRCRSISRTSQNGDLHGERAWLSHEGYYLRSTLYHLLLPAVFFRLIQRRMTLVDLDVDESIRIKYELVKLYFLALTDHFEFARLTPELPYDPDGDIPENERRLNPQIYYDQGLVYGHLDQIVDLMVDKDQDAERPITYGQFEEILSKNARDAVLDQLVAVFSGFEPDARPVLGRIIIGLATLSHLLMQATRAGRRPVQLAQLVAAFWADDDTLVRFAWQKGGRQDFAPFAGYFEKRLNDIQARHSTETKQLRQS